MKNCFLSFRLKGEILNDFRLISSKLTFEDVMLIVNYGFFYNEKILPVISLKWQPATRN